MYLVLAAFKQTLLSMASWDSGEFWRLLTLLPNAYLRYSVDIDDIDMLMNLCDCSLCVFRLFFILGNDDDVFWGGLAKETLGKGMAVVV